MFYWIRIGDAGDYHPFDDLDAALEYMNDNHVGGVDHWVHGPGVGIDTENFHSLNFVSLFWGDGNTDLIRPLNSIERQIIEAGLNVHLPS